MSCEHSAGIWRPRRKADPSTTRLLYVLVNSDTPTVLCWADIISPTGRVTVCPPLVLSLSTIVYPSVSVISPLILLHRVRTRSFQSVSGATRIRQRFTACSQDVDSFVGVSYGFLNVQLYFPITSFQPIFYAFHRIFTEHLEYDLKFTKTTSIFIVLY